MAARYRGHFGEFEFLRVFGQLETILVCGQVRVRIFLFRPEKNFPYFLGAAKIFSDYFKTVVSAK
jgi:hypothetical protein